jgi:hypothetical protein
MLRAIYQKIRMPSHSHNFSSSYYDDHLPLIRNIFSCVIDSLGGEQQNASTWIFEKR